ncbi:hypothetical protein ARMGADRAFT_1120637 [Armillaria gallica]|uniref:Uncharacterized protein n=1 Tax=Armillaria gallica TaxID=47427 RepID=A0A2H3CYU8_ARMGA|nr:hypothetical protein ARMGADRAFT_1120637 [Armillaria gallica]
MITTVVFGYRQRNEIIVVPIGTLFAFTQLRSTMPGAPKGFDFAGLLPCLVLLSICAVSMVGIYLFTDPNDPSRKAFTWDELASCSERVKFVYSAHLEHHHKMGTLCSNSHTDNEMEVI